MSDPGDWRRAENLLAVHISLVALDLFHQYAADYFDDVSSEMFVLRLQAEINKKTTEFLTDLGIDPLSVKNLPGPPE